VAAAARLAAWLLVAAALLDRSGALQGRRRVPTEGLHWVLPDDISAVLGHDISTAGLLLRLASRLLIVPLLLGTTGHSQEDRNQERKDNGTHLRLIVFDTERAEKEIGPFVYFYTQFWHGLIALAPNHSFTSSANVWSQ
jgi:hypothetical protein